LQRTASGSRTSEVGGFLGRGIKHPANIYRKRYEESVTEKTVTVNPKKRNRLTGREK
jgi:hypothetical protein